MPNKSPTPLRMISLRLPVSLHDRLHDVADRNRRTLTAELVIALEKHLTSEEQKPAQE